jgi:hypothetical protein
VRLYPNADHVKARSVGGHATDVDNLICSCTTCNERKGSRDGWQPIVTSEPWDGCVPLFAPLYDLGCAEQATLTKSIVAWPATAQQAHPATGVGRRARPGRTALRPDRRWQLAGLHRRPGHGRPPGAQQLTGRGVTSGRPGTPARQDPCGSGVCTRPRATGGRPHDDGGCGSSPQPGLGYSGRSSTPKTRVTRACRISRSRSPRAEQKERFPQVELARFLLLVIPRERPALPT